MHDCAKDVVAVTQYITAHVYLYILLCCVQWVIFLDNFCIRTSRPIWLFAAKGVVVHDFIMTLYEHVYITGLLHDSMFCARYDCICN